MKKKKRKSVTMMNEKEKIKSVTTKKTKIKSVTMMNEKRKDKISKL